MEILHHENEISYDKNIGSLFLCDNSYKTKLSVDPCECNRPTKRQVTSQILYKLMFTMLSCGT